MLRSCYMLNSFWNVCYFIIRSMTVQPMAVALSTYLMCFIDIYLDSFLSIQLTTIYTANVFIQTTYRCFFLVTTKSEDPS